MKITVNIDCTPEEARRFMGLPDVAGMQESMLKEMQEKTMANLTSLQPAEMMKSWPMGPESWLEFQKAIWQQMTSLTMPSDDKS